MKSRPDKEPYSDGPAVEGRLFDMPEIPEVEATVAGPTRQADTRVRCADRHQIRMQTFALDELLPDDHPARLVWEYVEGADVSPLYAPIRSVQGRAGRNAVDPKILLALWLYATLDGVGSAREVDRLCRDHAAYQWICGGVSMNYHTLSDFRVGHTAFLDALLTQSVATLMHEGLVTLNRVAQDGMRVRASAGAGSFRRRPTLESCQAEAREQVETLRAEVASDPAGANQRRKAARRRAARERSERIANALAQLPDVEAKKKPAEKGKARTSTTEPDARVMKMGDGGFRPAHNVQFATTTQEQVITGVDVINSGSDQGQMGPMVEQHNQRYGQIPDEMLVDGGFAKHEDIEQVSAPGNGTTVYAPVQKPKTDDRDAHLPRPGDSETIAAWRVRMGTDEAKAIYKERASTAECVNAIARNRGLRQFLVRGLKKVRAVVLLYALAHNLMRAVTLRREAALAVG
jgi:transposase